METTIYQSNLTQINPIPRIDTYFFKIHSNIVLGLPKGLFPVDLAVKILKALLDIKL